MGLGHTVQKQCVKLVKSSRTDEVYYNRKLHIVPNEFLIRAICQNDFPHIIVSNCLARTVIPRAKPHPFNKSYLTELSAVSMRLGPDPRIRMRDASVCSLVSGLEYCIKFPSHHILSIHLLTFQQGV